jgi:hypothetical protein
MSRRYSRFPAHLLPLLLPLLLLAGCSTLRQIAAKYPAPDLKRIYLPAAQDTEVIAERNPLVMIPGFGGSQLRDADGNIVWGAIYTKEALSFARAEGLRALALDVPEQSAPMSDEDAMAALYRLGDDSVASTAMVHFHTSVLVDVDFPIYARMLEGLATAGYRLEPPEVAAAVDAPRNPDGTPCFVFAFDWRLDLAGIAAQLDRFLDDSEAQVHAERKRRGVPDDPEKPRRGDGRRPRDHLGGQPAHRPVHHGVAAQSRDHHGAAQSRQWRRRSVLSRLSTGHGGDLAVDGPDVPAPRRRLADR